jgi:hypothetical protein
MVMHGFPGRGDRASWNTEGRSISYIDPATALRIAQSNLIKAAKKRQPRRGKTAVEYYGTKDQLEETIQGLLGTESPEIRITRNHYGCMVLNAARMLFIDVDVDESFEPAGNPGKFAAVSETCWSQTLNDLRTVLSHESAEGFRIYRTAAGFRVLGTAREFAPGSYDTVRLMKATGTDADFVKLCRRQQTFRARLTPKPWRCGLRRPPNAFPRQTVVEQRHFADWLEHYDNACTNRATCQFLEHVGPAKVSHRLAPIIEFHDRQTRAYEALPLA